jgi:hypothetical protein
MSLKTVDVSLNTQAQAPDANVKVEPNQVRVAFGKGRQVQWVLAPGQGMITGIDFKGASPFDEENRPTAANNWTGTEDNTNRSGAAVTFAYTVSVVFNEINYTTDPEVANQPGGPCVMVNLPSDDESSA